VPTHRRSECCSRVCFLPAGHAADTSLAAEVARRGAVLGVHVPLVCAGPQWDQTDLFQRQWEDAVEATQAAKAAGQKVKVVLHGALAADTWDLALAAANLCDAGVDILTVEALGSDVDEEELREKLDAMCENDVLGVPMTMRLGAPAPSPPGSHLCSQPSPPAHTDSPRERAVTPAARVT
jgi:hypothetical protein